MVLPTLQGRLLNIADNIDTYVQQMMEYAYEIIQENFDREGALGGGWPPLAPATVEAKGHYRALVDSGKLRDSLFLEQVGGEWKVGFRDEKAVIHEFGIAIRVTRKMRTYLAKKKGIKFGPRRRWMRIPERSMLRSVLPIINAKAAELSVEMFGMDIGWRLEFELE